MKKADKVIEKVAPTKVTAKVKEFREDVDKLVTLGQKKGFLTYDEVNATLSEDNSSDDMDQVFDILDGNDINDLNIGFIQNI